MSKRWGGELWGWENLGGELWFRQEFHQTHPGGFIRPLHTQTPSPGGGRRGKEEESPGTVEEAEQCGLREGHEGMYRDSLHVQLWG